MTPIAVSKKADGHNDATQSPHQCKELDLTIADREYWFDSMHVSTRCLTLAALAATLALAGCKTTGSGTGSIAPKPAVTATNGSTGFITALQGGIVARSGVTLSNSDKQRALEAEYRALEAAPGGQPVAWSGRGVSGEVVAAAPYQVGSQNCRQYTHTLKLEDRQAVARGAACRNANGSWSPLT